MKNWSTTRLNCTCCVVTVFDRGRHVELSTVTTFWPFWSRSRPRVRMLLLWEEQCGGAAGPMSEQLKRMSWSSGQLKQRELSKMNYVFMMLLSSKTRDSHHVDRNKTKQKSHAVSKLGNWVWDPHPFKTAMFYTKQCPSNNDRQYFSAWPVQQEKKQTSKH